MPSHHDDYDGPHCPDCGERDLDRLEWQGDDCEYVWCATCGFCWDPNMELVQRPA